MIQTATPGFISDLSGGRLLSMLFFRSRLMLRSIQQAALFPFFAAAARAGIVPADFAARVRRRLGNGDGLHFDSGIAAGLVRAFENIREDPAVEIVPETVE